MKTELIAILCLIWMIGRTFGNDLARAILGYIAWIVLALIIIHFITKYW